MKRKIIDQWQFSPFTKQVDIREARAEVKIVHIRELEFGETRIARCYDQLKDGRSELLNVTHIKGYWCYCLWPSQTWISGVLSSTVNVVRSSRTPIHASNGNHCNWFFSCESIQEKDDHHEDCDDKDVQISRHLEKLGLIHPQNESCWLNSDSASATPFWWKWAQDQDQDQDDHNDDICHSAMMIYAHDSAQV